MGAWIEIIRTILSSYSADVAPHVGAWIEISQINLNEQEAQSHPTWVRGLKFHGAAHIAGLVTVAPHVGAWIEIGGQPEGGEPPHVAPHVGAWIEIVTSFRVEPHD